MIDIIKNNKIIFVSGPAGTAKTFTAAYCALQALNNKRVSDILYIRPIVESSDTHMGYLPGTADEKVAPYGQIINDKNAEFLPALDVKKLKDDDRIHANSVSFARGQHWAAKFIIIDEAQSFTQPELITLMTRMGEASKMVICADRKQSDLKNGKNGGFIKLMSVFSDDESKGQGIQAIELKACDIVRSGLCKYIVEKLEKNETIMFGEH